MMLKTPSVAIAIDDFCAIEIIDDSYRIISSKPTGNAYKVFWKANKYHKKMVPKERGLKPLKELLKK